MSTATTVVPTLRVFTYDANEFGVAHNEVFGCCWDRTILYVRRPVRTGCDQGDVAVCRCFRSSMEAAKRAKIVRWPVKIDNEAKDIK